MSREVSRERTRSRTCSPDFGGQKILNLDSSPGSSRKIGEDGVEEGINIPNFSKEVSLDQEDDQIFEAVNRYLENKPNTEQLLTTQIVPTDNAQKNVSPKSILKRRSPAQSTTKTSESKDASKCCHPLVNKIKHIADKTLHKHDKSEKSPNIKRKKEKQEQPIVPLKSSPGAVRRHKFGTIKLGDSDEMSRTLSTEKSPTNMHKRKHIYEDIEQIEKTESEKNIHFSPEVLEALASPLEITAYNFDKDEGTEKKSNASQDPSLINEEENEQNLRPEEHIMESLHKHPDLENEALVLDVDSEEPDIEDVIKNQLEEDFRCQESSNITITEMSDDVYPQTPSPIIKSQENETPAIVELEEENILCTEPNGNWSKTNSDHEYEIIAKPPPNILFTSPSTEDNPVKAGDELSSTTSLELKYLQHPSDDEENQETNFDDSKNHSPAQIFQKEIEDRYFVNTPSTVSRTECDVSTSQVDSSALENLPLKRENRTNADNVDSKLQQRFKEQKEKIRSQAGKLKTKIQNMKTRQFSLPERSKFKLPQMPERPKFSLPDRRKFSLPERPKFKKINISEKLSIGDRKKFTFPDRPKFTMPDLPKFKIPNRAKINFSSLGRKKEYRIDSESVGSNEDVKHIATVEFESRTYPRIFNRKKKSDPLVSSSPVLNRADTPPPVFNFAKVSMKKTNEAARYYNNNTNDFDEPREYGGFDQSSSYNNDDIISDEPYQNNYDFDKTERDYDEENKRLHDTIKTVRNQNADEENTSSMPDVSLTQPKCTPVINEINNDEFFVRPKGISRENIEVRQYLSDEIREAFKMPSNSLAQMGTGTGEESNEHYIDGDDADPELYLNEEPEKVICNDFIDNDDGYYTFPPVRPSRAKKHKNMPDSVIYIDNNAEDITQFNENYIDINETGNINFHQNINEELEHATTDQKPFIFESKTLPLPPKRKKKSPKTNITQNSLSDLRRPTTSLSNIWSENGNEIDDIIVYRTEHSYVVPETITKETESPLPPRRRNRSRSSHGTSIVDDDRTSHGADSLVLDQNMSTADQGFDFYKDERPESPGYATVEKYPPAKIRRSKSKTPDAPRRRKSHSSERKYHSVDRVNKTYNLPDRPARKKSSTSLLTLENLQRDSSIGDITQYAEIDEREVDDFHKDLQSGDIVNKMKDRPLPPPPRPPRGSKKSKSNDNYISESRKYVSDQGELNKNSFNDNVDEEVVEIEVSTQTDPLPEDIDYELGMEENLDISMSSSLKDIGEDDIRKSQSKLIDSPRTSRPASRSDKSLIPSDPKIQELSRNNFGRTSPTVILVERRVSSPTRINERDEIVTEASLTVQPIDIDEDKLPEVPPLPKAEVIRPARRSSKVGQNTAEEKALEKIGEVGQVITDVQLDNLVTQRLQVRDLDVGRLNVSELQASKILVSEIEGMSMQVSELDSKSGHLSVSGIELSPSVIDEIVKKFSELAATTVHSHASEIQRPISREEQTQTDIQTTIQTEAQTSIPSVETAEIMQTIKNPDNMPETSTPMDPTSPPVRPPPPDLSPLLLSYLHDLSIPPTSFYQLRTPRERPFSEFFESQGSGAVGPPPPTRRVKRKPMYQNDSSSDEDVRKPSPRRMPSSPRAQDISITEAGAQFFRVCQNSVSRTLRRLFTSLMSYISGNEDKKDVQMALVIFLVLIAGLIMFGLSDGRAVHHHHWEFFNPPDSSK